MHVLVTGAAGYLGCNLVKKLNEEGVEVTIFHRSSSSLKNLEGLTFNNFVGDLFSKEDISNSLRDIDAVFHLAACTSLKGSDRQLRWKVNVDAVSTLIEGLKENPNIRLIYCSSIGAIGFSRHPAILNETSSFNAGYIDYFKTKNEAENLVLREVAQGLDAVIVNVGTLVGSRGMRGIQLKSFRKLAQGKMLFYPRGGSCFSFVKDVVWGIIQAWRKGKKGERYILGGHNMTFYEYFSQLADFFQSRPPSFALPSCVLPLAGFFAEKITGQLGRDTGILASGYGFYSSDKAVSELGYQITPFADVAKNIKENI